MKGPGPPESILLWGVHLNNIVGELFKLDSKNQIEGARVTGSKLLLITVVREDAKRN